MLKKIMKRIWFWTRWSERTARNLFKKGKTLLKKSMKVWKSHNKRIFNLCCFQADADGGQLTQRVLLFQKKGYTEERSLEAIDYNFNYDIFNFTSELKRHYLLLKGMYILHQPTTVESRFKKESQFKKDCLYNWFFST